MVLVVVDVRRRCIPCSIAFVNVLGADEGSQLRVGVATWGPPEALRQVGLPEDVGFLVAHSPDELHLLGKPCVQVAGADLADVHAQ